MLGAAMGSADLCVRFFVISGALIASYVQTEPDAPMDQFSSSSFGISVSLRRQIFAPMAVNFCSKRS